MLGTMAAFTDRLADDYAAGLMPAPVAGVGPWGTAIQYWMKQKRVLQADLVRATKIKKNAISRAVRGLPVTTNTLMRIATALEVVPELVLVSPEWMDRQESQRVMIQEAVERALQKSRETTFPSAISHGLRAVREQEQQEQQQRPDVRARPTPSKKYKGKGSS